MNRKKLVALLGVGLILLAAAGYALAPAKNEVVQIGGTEGVIFSAAAAEQMRAALGFVNGPVDGYWTPAHADVMALEEALEPYLRQKVGQSYPEVAGGLGRYKRQYFGFEANGQRQIAVNFFCNSYNIDWQQQLVFVTDGGSCFFEVTYDVNTGTFTRLSVHGEA